MPHVSQLDGLRALAILIVFVAHCGLEKVVPGGFGVTIFFVLSGYLITSLLRSEYANTGTIDIRKFYWRRTLRIWPPLYITLGISLLVMMLLFPNNTLDPWGIFAQLAFVSNYSYLWGHGSGVDLPLWSLAVEEHFYLIFPFLYVVCLGPVGPRAAAWICGILCGAVLAIRIAYVVTSGPLPVIYYWSHTRIDAILFGCCLALRNNPILDRDSWRPNRWNLAAAISVIFLCLVYRDPTFRQTVRYTLQGAAIYVVFSYVLHDSGRLSRLMSSPVLRRMGLYSYTFYLAHVLVIKICQEKLGINSLVPLIVTSGAITLVYCAVMYRFVESSFALRRRQLHTVDAEATLC